MKKLFGDYLAVGTGTWFANVSIVLGNLFLARYLGNDLFGRLALVLGINYLFVTLFDLGVSVATTRQVASSQGTLAGMRIASGLLLTLLYGLSATGCLVLFSYLFADAWYQPGTGALIRLTAFWMTPLFLIRFYGSVFDAMRGMRLSGISNLVTEGFRFSVILSFIFAQPETGLRPLLIGICAAYAIAWLVLTVLFLRFLRTRGAVMRISWAESREMFRLGFVLYLPLVGPVALPYFLILILGRMVGNPEIAAFTICLSLCSLGFLLLYPFSRVMHPLFSQAFASGNLEPLKGMVTVLTKAISLLGIVIFLTYALFGKFLLSLYGEAFRDSYPLLMILAFAVSFDLFRFLLNPFFNGSSLSGANAAVEVFRLLGGILLGYLLVARMGVLGCGAAMAAMHLIGNGIRFKLMDKCLETQTLSFLAKSGLTLAAAAALLTIASPLWLIPFFLAAWAALRLLDADDFRYLHTLSGSSGPKIPL